VGSADAIGSKHVSQTDVGTPEAERAAKKKVKQEVHQELNGTLPTDP